MRKKLLVLTMIFWLGGLSMIQLAQASENVCVSTYFMDWDDYTETSNGKERYVENYIAEDSQVNFHGVEQLGVNHNTNSFDVAGYNNLNHYDGNITFNGSELSEPTTMSPYYETSSDIKTEYNITALPRTTYKVAGCVDENISVGMSQEEIEPLFDYVYAGSELAVVDSWGGHLNSLEFTPNNDPNDYFQIDYDGPYSTMVVEMWYNIAFAGDMVVFLSSAYSYQLRVEFQGSNTVQIYCYSGSTHTDISFTYAIGDWIHLSVELDGTNAIATLNDTTSGSLAFSTAIGLINIWPEQEPILIDAIGCNQSNDYVVGSNWDMVSYGDNLRNSVLNLTHYNSTSYTEAYGLIDSEVEIGENLLDWDGIINTYETSVPIIDNYEGREKVFNMSHDGVASHHFIIEITPSSEEMYMELWVWNSASSSDDILIFLDNETNQECYFRLESSGRLCMYNYYNATSIMSSNDQYPYDEWFHLKIGHENGVMYMEVNQDNYSELPYTPVDDIIEYRYFITDISVEIYIQSLGWKSNGYISGTNYEPYGLVKDYKTGLGFTDVEYELSSLPTEITTSLGTGDKIEIIDHYDGHDKPIYFQNRIGGSSSSLYNYLYGDDIITESASIEFWFQTNDTSPEVNFYVREGTSLIVYMYISSGAIKNWDGTSTTVKAINTNQWYHISLNVSIGSLTYGISVDGDYKGEFDCYTTSSSFINNFRFTGRATSDIDMYFDAIRTTMHDKYTSYSNYAGVGTGAQWNTKTPLVADGDLIEWYQLQEENASCSAIITSLTDSPIVLEFNTTQINWMYQNETYDGHLRIYEGYWMKTGLKYDTGSIYMTYGMYQYKIFDGSYSIEKVIFTTYNGTTIYDSIDSSNSEDYYVDRLDGLENVNDIYNSSKIESTTYYKDGQEWNATCLHLFDMENDVGYDFPGAKSSLTDEFTNVSILMNITVDSYDVRVNFTNDFTYLSEIELIMNDDLNNTICVYMLEQTSMVSKLYVYDMDKVLLAEYESSSVESGSGANSVQIMFNCFTFLHPTNALIYAMDSNHVYDRAFYSYPLSNGIHNRKYTNFSVLDVYKAYELGMDEWDLDWDEENDDFVRQVDEIHYMNATTDENMTMDLEREQKTAYIRSGNGNYQSQCELNVVNLNVLGGFQRTQILTQEANEWEEYYVFQVNKSDPDHQELIEFNSSRVPLWSEGSAWHSIDTLFGNEEIVMFSNVAYVGTFDASSIPGDMVTVIYELYGNRGILNITFVELDYTQTCEVPINDETALPGFEIDCYNDFFYYGGLDGYDHAMVHEQLIGVHELSLTKDFKYTLPSADPEYELYFGKLYYNMFTACHVANAVPDVDQRLYGQLTLYTDYNSTYKTFGRWDTYWVDPAEYVPDTISENYYLDYNITWYCVSTHESRYHNVSFGGELEWNVWIRYVGLDEGIFGMMLQITAPFLIFLLFPWMFKNFGKKGSIVGVGMGMVIGFIIMGYTGMLDITKATMLLILSGITLLLMLKKEQNNPGNKITVNIKK